MIEVRETPEFTRWLAALKDRRAVLHIVRRISRLAAGNTGDDWNESQQAQRFDAAEHLRTPEARAEYLNIVLADGDPAEVRDALNIVARAQGMSEVAKAAGVTREGFYKTLGADGNPEFATIMRVIGAMGIRLSAQAANKKPKKRAVA